VDNAHTLSKPSKRFLVAVTSLIFFLGMAELGLRLFEFSGVSSSNLPQRFRTYYRDADYVELDPTEATQRGFVSVISTEPRIRLCWTPGLKFHICYDGPPLDYFDEHGCVPVEINSKRIRDREDLCDPKPEGQFRIVCIGDSFTFGWGVRIEDAWVRLIEKDLRLRTGRDIRSVNCGASGATVVDEYALALRGRFGEFEPDAVLVSLCLNDLIPSNEALAHHDETAARTRRHSWWSNSRLLSMFVDAWRNMPYPGYTALQIDPERDLVGQLNNHDFDALARAGSWPALLGEEVFWRGGGPQKGLLDMQAYCQQRGIPFGVSIWPYIQGLGRDEHYPFTKMHDLVREYCAEHKIPCIDLLPVLKGYDTDSLWVSPADYHPNDRAQELVRKPLTDFIAELCGF